MIESLTGDEHIFVEVMVAVLVGAIGMILHRVWSIPTIQEKVYHIGEETDRNREKLHEVNNHLQHHETRITLLEKSEEERTKSAKAS